MRYQIIFAFSSLFLFNAHAATREEVISWVSDPAFSAFEAKDFEVGVTDTGKEVSRADKIKKNGLLVNIVGTDSNSTELNVIGGLGNVDAQMFFIWIGYITGKAMPNWEGSAEWIMKAIQALAEAEGGEASMSLYGQTLTVKIVKPAVLLYSLEL